MKYNYCPVCGRKLSLKVVGDEGLKPHCSKCDKFYFDRVRPCVIALVMNEFDEVVLIKQSKVSAEHWVVVAGYLSGGENFEEAVAREVLEETGQVVNFSTYLGSYPVDKKELVMSAFQCDVNKLPFNRSKEVDDIKWVKLNDAIKFVPPESVAFKLISKLMHV
ncbi:MULTISPECIES: NUDIX domain-containing protein [unclassified Fusibacter]|uniref:NUDIX domain-containing protein n=1 Tax=unclassified Fusibacter TaxID=2624464 RepID=UPI001011D002|nr:MULTISPECIES: NUDIX domain-containing protein [unclassified Fusibacter]MCK8061475.1 NUDIX domain-containing protein [Fusibacter sp. A2]NPE23660.1 NUDIX domain-containing protein [Fusibacter sp. A1]RXV58839.1 NUDIX domain-containing protein [Fusibacter sp. A1]